MKVLFVYPNVTKVVSLQLGICMLSAVAKEDGHIIDLFDITFTKENNEKEELIKKIESFKPHIIAISSRSNEWSYVETVLSWLKYYKNNYKFKIVVGGPHATVAPKEILENKNVDFIIRGEGEYAFKELLNALQSDEDYYFIKNLGFRKNDKIVLNDVRPLIQNLDELPFPDWDLFDKKHVTESIVNIKSRGKRGKKLKGVGVFETSRGCPYRCTYCINPFLQDLYKGKGKYHRTKSINRVIDEVKLFTSKYSIDYIYFIDETFLINTKRLREFSRLYKKFIDLPFFFLARPEGVTEERIKLMKDAGGHFISIGIESGDEEFRKKYLKRYVSNKDIINAFKIAKKCGLITYSYNMIGFPHEKRENIRKTMELNNAIQPDYVQVSIFTPYKGTELRDLAIRKGFLDKNYIPPTSYYKRTMLKNFSDMDTNQINRLNKLIMIFALKDRKYWPIMYFLEKHKLPYFIFIFIYTFLSRSDEMPIKIRQLGFAGLIKKVLRDII